MRNRPLGGATGGKDPSKDLLAAQMLWRCSKPRGVGKAGAVEVEVEVVVAVYVGRNPSTNDINQPYIFTANIIFHILIIFNFTFYLHHLQQSNIVKH